MAKVQILISDVKINDFNYLFEIIKKFNTDDYLINTSIIIDTIIKNKIKNKFIITSNDDIIFIREYLNLLLLNFDKILSMFENKFVINNKEVILDINGLEKSINILNKLTKINFIENPNTDKLNKLLKKRKFKFSSLNYIPLTDTTTSLGFPFVKFEYRHLYVDQIFNTNLICYINKFKLENI